jgi:hypothetical protein
VTRPLSVAQAGPRDRATEVQCRQDPPGEDPCAHRDRRHHARSCAQVPRRAGALHPDPRTRAEDGEDLRLGIDPRGAARRRRRSACAIPGSAPGPSRTSRRRSQARGGGAGGRVFDGARSASIAERLRAVRRPGRDRGQRPSHDDTCKDLDIIATYDPAALTKRSPRWSSSRVGSSSEASAASPNGLRIDPAWSPGPVRQRDPAPDRPSGTTSSFAEYAVRRGMRVSEYGVGGRIREDHRCPSEEGVYGSSACRSSSRAARGRGECGRRARASQPGRARRPEGGPALPHDPLGRAQLPRRDGRGGAGSRLRLPGDHRPLRQPRLRNDVQADGCCGRSSGCVS